MKKTCLICKKTFETNISNQIYCDNPECKTKGHRMRERARMAAPGRKEFIVCANPECRKKVPYKPSRKFCSRACRDAMEQVITVTATHREGEKYCLSCERWRPLDEFRDDEGKAIRVCRECREIDSPLCDEPTKRRVCHHPGCTAKTDSYYCEKHRRKHFRLDSDTLLQPGGMPVEVGA